MSELSPPGESVEGKLYFNRRISSYAINLFVYVHIDYTNLSQIIRTQTKWR